MTIITLNPRCPQHPRHAVWASYSGHHGWAEWICAACRRPLGLHSLGSVNEFGPAKTPWPQGRRPTLELVATEKVDWGWLFDFAEKHHQRAV